MRRTALTLAALALTAAPALADPSHGLWKTQPDDNGNFGHVQMQTCSNGRICGGLVAAFGPNGQPVPSDQYWPRDCLGHGARHQWPLRGRQGLCPGP